MTPDDTRPDPDALLSRLSPKEEGPKRGRLRIFFGSSAGVGKTYAMLEAAHEHRKQKEDVLVGIIETHGRPETADLLNDLTVLPPLKIKYRGLTLEEFDLDGALGRKPDLLLVDELAHTNAPGARHPKRWNDVVELLEAGINVYTTLNVQHVESLSDIVAESTGVWVKETIPDKIFDMADDVVLVDIDEDDLIQRLHEGKVYLAPGAMARAAENFFKKSNLGALREIALRRTADRVDALRELDDTKETNAVSEKILVCISADEMAPILVRHAKRMATGLKAPWEAIHIDKPQLDDPQTTGNEFLSKTERMIERMGGKMTVLSAHDVVGEIISYARENRFTKIIVGKDSRKNLRGFLSTFFIHRILQRSGTIDVYIVTSEKTKRIKQQKHNKKTTSFLHIIAALLLGAALTIPSFTTYGIFTPLDQGLIYLIGVVIVADHFGFLPSLLYSLLTATAFHFFMLHPHYQDALGNKSSALSLFLLLMTSYIIATQTARLHAQTLSSRFREKQTRDLLSLTRALTSVHSRFSLAKLVASHIEHTLGGECTVWMVNHENHLAIVLGDLPQATYYKDFGALLWCIEHNQVAGFGSETLPSASGFYLPLATDQGVIGVLGYLPRDPETSISRAGQEALEAIASLLATALARVKAGETKEEEKPFIKPPTKEGSRDFLGAMSEPNPMTASSSKHSLSPVPKIDARIVDELASILDGTERNILPSFDHGRKTTPRTMPSQSMDARPVALIGLIEKIKTKMAAEGCKISLDIDIPSNLPDVRVDEDMIGQALQTFFRHALQKVEPDAPLHLTTSRTENYVCLNIILPACPLPKRTCALTLLEELTAEAQARQNEVDVNVAISLVQLHGGQADTNALIDNKTTYFMTLPTA